MTCVTCKKKWFVRFWVTKGTNIFEGYHCLPENLSEDDKSIDPVKP